MMPRIPRLSGDKWLLLLLAGFFTGITALWLHLNRGTTSWDDSWYLGDGLKMFDRLCDEGLHGWLIAFFGAQGGVRPPLMCALPTPIYLIFGRNVKFAFGVQLFFYPMILFCLFGIVKKYWNSRAALIAVFIAGSMPEIYGLSTWYLVEFGLAALAALAIWALVRSEDLTRTGFVILFSSACGLGLLQKILFPLYVGPLALYFFWRWLKRIRHLPAEGEAKVPWPMKTLASLILPVILIAGPWYAYNGPGAIKRAIFSGYDTTEASLYGTGEPFTLRAVLLYLQKIVNEGIGPSYFLIAVAVVIALIAAGIFKKLKPTPGWKGWIVLFWWLASFGVFLFGRNKDVRFISPLLLAFPIVLAVGIDLLIRGFPRLTWALVIPAFAMPLFCQFAIDFHPLWPRYYLAVAGGKSGYGNLYFVADRIGACRAYAPENWPIDQVMRELARAGGAGKNGKVVRIIDGSSSYNFNHPYLQLVAMEDRLPVDVTTTAYTTDEATLDQQIQAADIFVVRTGGEEESGGYNKLRASARRDAAAGGFQHSISRIRFPDGGVMHVYVNKAAIGRATRVFLPAAPSRIDPCDVSFDQKISLIGLSHLQSGGNLIVRFNWRCDGQIPEEYRCFLHVVDETGKVIRGYDHDPLMGDPILPAWQPGDHGAEEISIPLSYFGAASTARLDIGLYLPRDQSILKSTAENLPAGGSMMRDNIGIHVEFPLGIPVTVP